MLQIITPNTHTHRHTDTQTHTHTHTHTAFTPLCNIQRCDSILSLMSHSVASTGLLPLPLAKQGLTTSMIRLAQDRRAGFTTEVGRELSKWEALQTNAGKVERGTDRKDGAFQCVHCGGNSLRMAQRVENISIPSCYATHFLIHVRLESHTGGSISSGFMF